ncbi:MAG: DNA polymerase I [Eubacteriales bacterium]|nr:DNA polymerase I [Eubacteriales bacterium]
MSRRLAAIDGNSLMHRAFYALPHMTAPDGQPSNAVYGFLGMLLRIVQDYQPDLLAVAFDMHGPTFRHEVYEEYKAGRRATPEDLRPQFPMLKEALAQMGVPCLEAPTFEADDILGTLARLSVQQGVQAFLFTGDKDALQLVSDSTTVVLTQKGVSETVEYDPARMQEVYGFTPEKITDLKGLMGDSSDNIPGIAGVGEKTALKLLADYGSLEGVLSHAGEIKGKLGEKVRAGEAQARFSQKLATIVPHAPIEEQLDRYAFAGMGDGALDAVTRLGMGSLAARIQKMAPAARLSTVEQEKIERTDVQSAQELADAAGTLTGDTAVLLTGTHLYLANGEREYAVRLRQTLLDEGLDLDEALGALKAFFAADTPKVLHDIKSWLHLLDARDMALRAAVFDVMIGEYLLEPMQDNGQEAILQRYVGGEPENPGAALLRVSGSQRKSLDEKGMRGLYDDMEHPLIFVLFRMEQVGFRVDPSILSELGSAFNTRIEELVQRIWQAAGGQFNINSPKQLGEVLFERLGLPAGKRTKSGWSTDASVLEQLLDQHEIVAWILEYRQLAKLKSTYVDALVPLAAAGRVHTTLNQAVTATGRISSSEPNLQNIPVRGEMGRQIRKAFVAADEEHILVDADYSQIELRVLAHMAGDPGMQAAFLSGGDIHRQTAAEVFGVPPEEVTSQMRSSAKAVNFGIVYGISDFGLANQLSISRATAHEYIQKYLHTYAGVDGFMKEMVERGKTQGYVSTLLGRRRPLPELKSSNYNTRSFGERVAMNAPIQGTAADIIKLAMVRVDQALAEHGLKSRLVLQVHDELIIDTLRSEEAQVAALLKDTMENVMKMDVPLRADVSTGKSWYDAK